MFLSMAADDIIVGGILIHHIKEDLFDTWALLVDGVIERINQMIYSFGMGVERITNLKYRVSDLRMFSENDTRFLEEFESAN